MDYLAKLDRWVPGSEEGRGFLSYGKMILKGTRRLIRQKSFPLSTVEFPSDVAEFFSAYSESNICNIVEDIDD